MKKYKVYNEIESLINSDFQEYIILDGYRSIYKSKLCEYLCEKNHYSFQECTFEEFMDKKPYLDKDKKMIYVNDYLTEYGRIFNNYERDILSNLPNTNNLIVFNTDNINKIKFKDDAINNKFRIIQFPLLLKENYSYYIFKIIEYYGYHEFMYQIDWCKYNIHKLGAERLKMLLFEIDYTIRKSKDSRISDVTIQDLTGCI